MIDIAPTILDVAGSRIPTRVNGVEQIPLHGVQHALLLRRRRMQPTGTRRSTSRSRGNRGIYHDGWTAVTKHATPWIAMAELPAFADDVWELYAPDDWTQANDLAERRCPTSSQSCKQVFLRGGPQVQRPATGRPARRAVRRIALPGRPKLITGRRQILYGGMGRLTEATVLNIKNVSHAVAADIEVPAGGAAGVIIAQGGAFGGWSLYLRGDGVPVYCYNLLGLAARRRSPLTSP